MLHLHRRGEVEGRCAEEKNSMQAPEHDFVASLSHVHCSFVASAAVKHNGLPAQCHTTRATGVVLINYPPHLRIPFPSPSPIFLYEVFLTCPSPSPCLWLSFPFSPFHSRHFLNLPLPAHLASAFPFWLPFPFHACNNLNLSFLVHLASVFPFWLPFLLFLLYSFSFLLFSWPIAPRSPCFCLSFPSVVPSQCVYIDLFPSLFTMLRP